MANKDTDNLVEQQGVNAGEPNPGAAPDQKPDPAQDSAQDSAQHDGPAQRPDPRQGLIGYPALKTDEQLTGGPVPEHQEDPGTKDGSSGQDEGLMD
ncbi:hypothetical protein KIH74_11520 [Kineosporia sp. J2-2]|uniref:Uncharacterized protein n=1 Tax=Kineosporia corallincola TaxID=2835133 RepID=A0ABS5TJ06_9ACTN|nr:hypothetical protein [Kineosporia corallincola]MBT0769554.1 hypothetical protein [Kineosporia corallincola]